MNNAKTWEKEAPAAAVKGSVSPMLWKVKNMFFGPIKASIGVETILNTPGMRMFLQAIHFWHLFCPIL